MPHQQTWRRALVCGYRMYEPLKPMPAGLLTPCLAESWTESPDGLIYDFKLRQGVTFHNGDPLTAADVVFSFQRYKGAGKTVYQEKVAAIELLDAHRVRFQRREPWPDFLLFLGTPATGAGLIVPQKYLEQVGDDGFKRHPIGAGPYKFVSHTPGVDLVLEAHGAYWRKTPQVKRLVFKGILEPTTRLVALKKGEVDIAYALNGEMGWAVQRNPQLTLRVVSIPTTYWLEFPGKWDPKSPWHDRRVRLATNYAIAWRTTSPPGESLHTEVIPTSTSCFRNSPASSILRAEKSCCTSCNAWCMSASWSSSSTRALDSPALVHAWRNQLWA